MTIKRLDVDPRSEEQKKADEELLKHIGCCDPEKRLIRYAAFRSYRGQQKAEAAKVGLSLAAYRKKLRDGDQTTPSRPS